MTTEPTETPTETNSLQPLLKWVGGKRFLLRKLRELLPADYRNLTHVEPFFGGGALFFDRNPKNARLSDINEDLMSFYQVVKWTPKELHKHLSTLISENVANYYDVRDFFNKPNQDVIPKAAAFLYLNRTCFNGLYKVNQKNEFNVPAGKYENPSFPSLSELISASQTLKNAMLRTSDFEDMLADCSKGDFVYLDPPYEGAYSQYTSGGFGFMDHVRLAKACQRLDQKGVKWLLSNSDTFNVRNLYPGYEQIEVSLAQRVNSDGQGRGARKELLIRNYK